MTGNSDVDQAVTEYFLEEVIEALETSCTHRVSILVGKTRATHTRMQGRFVMGQLGMPREDSRVEEGPPEAVLFETLRMDRI